MIFQMGCGQVYHDEESWEDGFKYYDGHSLKIEDADMYKEEYVVSLLERTLVELKKTTIVCMIYIDVNDCEKYYNSGEEIIIQN